MSNSPKDKITKLTLKQENFCLKYIETGNASEAYRHAYDTSRMNPDSVNRKAKEVMDNVKIAARIADLRKPFIEKHEVTVDSLIKELEEAREAALKAETVQSSAAVSATMGKAKLLGFGVEKLELTVNAELAARLKNARERAAKS